MVEWPVLASNSSHCNPVNSIHFYLCYLSKSVCRCGLKSWAKSSICIDYIVVNLAPQPWIGLPSQIKINSEGPLWLSTKITPHTVPQFLEIIFLSSKFCCTFKWPSQFCKHNTWSVGAWYRVTGWILALTRGNKEKEDNQVITAHSDSYTPILQTFFSLLACSIIIAYKCR